MSFWWVYLLIQLYLTLFAVSAWHVAEYITTRETEISSGMTEPGSGKCRPFGSYTSYHLLTVSIR